MVNQERLNKIIGNIDEAMERIFTEYNLGRSGYEEKLWNALTELKAFKEKLFEFKEDSR